MTKPLSRQQVFRLTAEEQAQVEKLLVQLNYELECMSGGPLREHHRLLSLGMVSPLVLYEVESRFRAAGYLVESTTADHRGPATMRLK